MRQRTGEVGAYLHRAETAERDRQLATVTMHDTSTRGLRPASARFSKLCFGFSQNTHVIRAVKRSDSLRALATSGDAAQSTKNITHTYLRSLARPPVATQEGSEWSLPIYRVQCM